MTTETGERANPFGDLATDFAPAPQPKKPVQTAAIDSIAEANGFPSRQPPKLASSSPKASQPRAQTQPKPAAEPSQRQVRRYTTGRNRQLNLKASDETITTFYRLADELGVPLAEAFEQAVAALDAQSRTKR